jgi:hypothetical protein
MLAPRRRRTAVALSIAGLACACSTAPLALGAAGSQPACAPSDGLRSANIARAVRPDGTSEVTEFASDGGYRVTRCADGGRVVVSQTVSPILAPGGGTVLVPTERAQPGVTVAMLYGDPSDKGWAAEFDRSRATLAAQVIAPTVATATPPVAQPLPPAVPAGAGSGAPSTGTGSGGPPAAGGGTRGPRTPGAAPSGGQVAVAAVAGDACTNSQFNFWETSWAHADYSYYVNRSRFNYNDTTVDSIVDGHRNWDTTFNSCGLNDITDLTSHHLGSTSETIHTGPDGKSVTDKGSLASICPGALACTWLFADETDRTTETDQRFNENITFSNVGAAGAYDYESIATHESGHSIGLDHANSSNALTMYFQIASGTTYQRSLAKGDVLGLRARYP